MERPVTVRARDSLPGAAISGLINATTSYFAFRGHERVPLSVDAISGTTDTAWSRGVIMAFVLGAVVTLMSARRFRQKALHQAPSSGRRSQPSFFPFVVWTALGNALLLFGAFVVIALFWQRFFGTIEVSPLAASILVGVVAATVVMVAEVRTKRAMMNESERLTRPPNISAPTRV